MDLTHFIFFLYFEVLKMTSSGLSAVRRLGAQSLANYKGNEWGRSLKIAAHIPKLVSKTALKLSPIDISSELTVVDTDRSAQSLFANFLKSSTYIHIVPPSFIVFFISWSYFLSTLKSF